MKLSPPHAAGPPAGMLTGFSLTVAPGYGAATSGKPTHLVRFLLPIGLGAVRGFFFYYLLHRIRPSVEPSIDAAL